MRDFLVANPVPDCLTGHLSDEFRAFCLLLNALKQWVNAEQAATDRFLLGGKSREECRGAALRCVVSGENLSNSEVELHHPVRDGRPPIPLSKQYHAQIEGQISGTANSDVRSVLLKVKRQGSRSWIQLRRGCMDLVGRPVKHSTPKVAATSRTFARKAVEASGLTFDEILNWLNQHDLGMPPE